MGRNIVCLGDHGTDYYRSRCRRRTTRTSSMSYTRAALAIVCGTVWHRGETVTCGGGACAGTAYAECGEGRRHVRTLLPTHTPRPLVRREGVEHGYPHDGPRSDGMVSRRFSPTHMPRIPRSQPVPVPPYGAERRAARAPGGGRPVRGPSITCFTPTVSCSGLSMSYVDRICRPSAWKRDTSVLARPRHRERVTHTHT
jgi:hypothetical protein